MLGMSSYRAGNWDAAAREFGDFASDFPEHPSCITARVYQGNCYYLQKNYISAIKAYLLAYNFSQDEENSEVIEVARESARRLLWGYLKNDELLLVAKTAEGSSSQLVDYIRAKRALENGEEAHALDICKRSLAKRSKGIYADSLKTISERTYKELSERITIAVFAPTSGPYAEYGLGMVNGIRLAISQYEKNNKASVELIVENTSGDALVGAYSVKKVIPGYSPVAAIGPLLSEVAIAVGAFCDQYRTPMISPSASKDGLAGLSPFIFQVAVPPSVGAEKLAEYAIDSLEINRFSALAPDDPVGRKAVANFANRVEELGGEVVSAAYYAEGTVDFSDHLRKIRKPFFDQIERRVAIAETTDTRFYKPDGTLRPPEEWIVSIPAIFVPAYYDDLVNILPQIPFNYIQTRLLGANGWIIEEMRHMESSYIDSAVVIPDDLWADKDTYLWEDFSRDFRKAYGEQPDRIAALGYDAAQIVCQGLSKGAVTPEQLRDYLSALNGYSGPSGNVSFDATGTNTEAILIRFERNTPKRIR